MEAHGKHRGDERDHRRDERYTCPAEMQSDETGTIEAIGGEVRDRLCAMGVRPGKRLTVQAKQPFGGPITVSVGRNVTSFDDSCARQITIRVDNARDVR